MLWSVTNKVLWLLVILIYFENQSDYEHRFRSSRPEVFCRKGVLKNFAKFTGKHLCQSLFFNEVTGFNQQFYEFVNFSEHLSLENTSGGCFWVMNIDSTNRTE